MASIQAYRCIILCILTTLLSANRVLNFEDLNATDDDVNGAQAEHATWPLQTTWLRKYDAWVDEEAVYKPYFGHDRGSAGAITCCACIDWGNVVLRDLLRGQTYQNIFKIDPPGKQGEIDSCARACKSPRHKGRNKYWFAAVMRFPAQANEYGKDSYKTFVDNMIRPPKEEKSSIFKEGGNTTKGTHSMFYIDGHNEDAGLLSYILGSSTLPKFAQWNSYRHWMLTTQYAKDIEQSEQCVGMLRIRNRNGMGIGGGRLRGVGEVAIPCCMCTDRDYMYLSTHESARVVDSSGGSCDTACRAENRKMVWYTELPHPAPPAPNLFEILGLFPNAIEEYCKTYIHYPSGSKR